MGGSLSEMQTAHNLLQQQYAAVVQELAIMKQERQENESRHFTMIMGEFAALRIARDPHALSPQNLATLAPSTTLAPPQTGLNLLSGLHAASTPLHHARPDSEYVSKCTYTFIYIYSQKYDKDIPIL